MSRKYRIFITEDELIIARDLQSRLKLLGYEIAGIAHTGEATLENLRSMPADIVLIDINLTGGLDGIETAALIKKEHDVPIIFLTAYSNKAFIERARTVEPFAFIIKPFHEQDLHIRIELALQKHESEKKLKEKEKELLQLNQQLEMKVAERTHKLNLLNTKLRKEIQENIKTNMALKVSESEYKGLFENAHDAIIIIEPDTEGVLEANQRACEIYGYNRDEFMQLSMLSIVKHGLGSRNYTELLSESDGRYSFETTHYRKDGSLMWLEVNVTMIWYNNRKALLSINRDITERKLTEQALRDSEKKYKYLAESIPQIVFETDENARITFMNKYGRDIFGYTEEEIIGMPLVRLFSSSKIKNRAVAASKEMQRKNMLGAEYRASRKNDERFEVLAYSTTEVINNRFRGIRGILIDISERKKDEAKLRKLVRVIEQAEENVIITDNKGIIEYVNPAFTRTLGYPYEEAIGKDPKIIKSGLHNKEFYENLWNTILSGKIVEGTFINKKKNNEFVYEEKRISPLKDKKGKITHFVSTGRNITSKVLAEQKLAENEKRFYSLIQNSSDITMVIDRNGTILYGSPAIGRVLGYSEDEIIGNNLFGFIHPDDLQSAQQHITSIAATPQTIDIIEFRFCMTEGSYVVLESVCNNRLDDPSVKGIILNSRDITERKNSEQKIIESQKFITSITDAIPEMIYILDLKEKRMVYVNNKITDILGYDPSDIRNFDIHFFRSLVHPDDLEKYHNRYWSKRQEQGNDIFEYEARVKHKNGKYKWVLNREVVFGWNSNNEPVHLLGSSTDISEKKSNERRLKAMSKLQTINKQRAQAIRSLSLLKGQEDERRRISREIHDGLGQMLTAVKLNLETLSGSGNHSVEEREHVQALLEMLKDTIAEARRLSHDLMPSELYDFGLVPALKHLVGQLNRGSKIAVRFEHDKFETVLERNVEISIYRIVQEALNNALKHSDAHNIRVILTGNSSSMTLEVSDDGKGFRTESLSTIGYGRNKGIGINNMRERVALIGGELRLTSAVGKGTTIHVTINTKRKITNGKDQYSAGR